MNAVVGGGVLVGELREPRPERLRAHDRLLVAGEAAGELDERRRERGGQRGRRTARGRRRALAERRQELTDWALGQAHACRTARRSGGSGVFPRIRSAARSATIIVGA